ncbi:DUF397 domain-containing protein [Nocardia xishanensis]|uniref:DUF397 domain-containing protein n=1 Tax=Nocardia xishanensis TaxID=238964 RepID=UPI0033DD7751
MSSDPRYRRVFPTARQLFPSHADSECVEVAFLDGGHVRVRDSKDPTGSALIFTRRSGCIHRRSLRRRIRLRLNTISSGPAPIRHRSGIAVVARSDLDNRDVHSRTRLSRPVAGCHCRSRGAR